MEGPFWETMNILTDKKWGVNRKELDDDMDEWVDKIFRKNDDVSKKRDTPSKHGGENDDGGSVLKRFSEYSAGEEQDLDEYDDEDSEMKLREVKRFLKSVRIPKIECNFNLPYVRSRMEKLMGTHYVSITDRNFMQRLQERILEDYAESMDKRIQARESQEMERVKRLVLTGTIPLSQAPPEMANHPIMLIEAYCNKLIAARRAKIKILKVTIPTFLYWDDTPDPPSGLSIECGHVFRQKGERLCHLVDRHLAEDDEDIENGYMLPAEEFEKVKYESPLVKGLMDCETVEEMYELADKIIGILKTIDETTKVPEDNISEILNNTPS